MDKITIKNLQSAMIDGVNEAHVVSQGLAVELKRNGWPQEGSAFYWIKLSNGSWRLQSDSTCGGFDCDVPIEWIKNGSAVAAPLTTELMEMMPYEGDYWFQVTRKSAGLWKAELYSKRGGWVCSFLEMELPDALAKLALHLMKENKLDLE